MFKEKALIGQHRHTYCRSSTVGLQCTAANRTLDGFLCVRTWTGLFVAQLSLHTVPFNLNLRGTRCISSQLTHTHPVSWYRPCPTALGARWPRRPRAKVICRYKVQLKNMIFYLFIIPPWLEIQTEAGRGLTVLAFFLWPTAVRPVVSWWGVYTGSGSNMCAPATSHWAVRPQWPGGPSTIHWKREDFH